jgi:DNA transposition AAA+ family ATPase
MKTTEETVAAGGAATLRQRVLDEIARARISDAQVAKESGMSAAKLSQWKNNIYPGDNAAVEKQLGQWLDGRASAKEIARDLPAAPGWVKTPTAEKIYNTLAYAQMAGVAACIFGGAGVGKTIACEHYQATHNNVWIVTASPAASTYTQTLKRIAAASGLRSVLHSSADLELELIGRLKNTKGLLIFDESQLLSTDALWGVKHLFDCARIGVAYVGSEQIYANLNGRRAELNAPLFRRISKKQALKRPEPADVAALLAAWGIAGRAEIDYCARIAAKPGALGMVTETVRLAAFLALGDNAALGLGYLRAAYKDLGGEV